MWLQFLLKLDENFFLSEFGWLVDWLNVGILLFLPTWKIMDFFINVCTCSMCTERPPPYPEHFLNERFCFAKCSIISPKVQEIFDEPSNSKLPSLITYFKCTIFFFFFFIFFSCINILLILWKSAKFSINYWNLNFFRS